MAPVRGQILNFWEQHGYSPAAAAGFAGNAQQESSFNPNEAGGGLYQQSGYPASYGQGSVQQQSQHVLENLPRSLVGALQHVRGPREAARLISQQYERPGIPDLSNRERYAWEALREAQRPGGEAGFARTAGTGPSLSMPGTSGAQQSDIASLIALMGQKRPGQTVATNLPRAGEESEGAKVPMEVAAPQSQMKKLTEALGLVGRIGEDAGEPAGVVPGSGGLGAQGYASPHPQVRTLGRSDQGVDYVAPQGTEDRAIGNGRVLGISPNWYQGQPYEAYQLESGPEKGKIVYVAEGIEPQVHAGEHVRKGQGIARYTSQPTGVEEGFGSPTLGETLAKATTGYSEGQETPAGKNFRRFLESLGR